MAEARIGKGRLATLLGKLEKHALGETELTPSQIRAIELLLRKDNAPAAGTKEDASRAIVIRFERRIVYPEGREPDRDV